MNGVVDLNIVAGIPSASNNIEIIPRFQPTYATALLSFANAALRESLPADECCRLAGLLADEQGE